MANEEVTTTIENRASESAIAVKLDAYDGVTLRLSYLSSMLSAVGVAMTNADGHFAVSDSTLGEALCGMALVADDIRDRLIDGTQRKH